MPQHATNAFRIEVDGSPLDAAVANTLLEADVEDELNGLLTYDREVLKLDVDVVRNALRELGL